METAEQKSWWKRKRVWVTAIAILLLMAWGISKRSQNIAMEVRTYPLGEGVGGFPGFTGGAKSKLKLIIAVLTGEYDENLDIEKFFKANGVSFPPGAYASLDLGYLVVRNTRKNLGKIEELMDWNCILASQVQIIATLVEVHDPDLAGKFRDGSVPAAKIKALPKDQVVVVDSISVVTTSGSQTQIKNVTDVPYSLEIRSGEDPGELLSVREVGTTLNLTPVVGSDGRTINVTVIWERSRVVGWDKAGLPEVRAPMPIIRSQNFTTSVVLNDGETLAFQVGETTSDYLEAPGQEALPNRPKFLVLTAQVIGTDGLPIPRENDNEDGQQPISAERVY